ncbi:hypothetical protein RJG79_10750 [Mycoplasmatota bacterium WC44]
MGDTNNNIIKIKIDRDDLKKGEVQPIIIEDKVNDEVTRIIIQIIKDLAFYIFKIINFIKGEYHGRYKSIKCSFIH